MTREEAIKVARIIDQTDAEKEALETLIPELRESEDERMQKGLIQHLKELRDWKVGTMSPIKVSSHYDAWIAYLEKQKEYKPAECVPDSIKFDEGFKTGREVGFREGVESVKLAEWSDEDENIRQSLILLVSNDKKNGYTEFYRAQEITCDKVIAFLKKLKQLPTNEEMLRTLRVEYEKGVADTIAKYEQKEQKPVEWSRQSIIDALTKWLTEKIAPLHKKSLNRTITEREEMFMATLLEMRSLVNSPDFQIGKDTSVEWSEKDKFKLKEIIALIGYSPISEDLKNEYISFLKYIRPQPKQEWSEEDRKNINSIAARLDSILDCSNATEAIKITKEIGWLKSLRPSWKLSEDEERLINTSISFLKDFADKGYENAVECIDWLKSKLNGNSCK